MTTNLQNVIGAAFEDRQNIKLGQKGEIAEAVEAALALLDSGRARVAEKKDGEWIVHTWLKKAVLLSFRLNDNRIMGPAIGAPVTGPTSPGPWWDKVPTKFSGWTEDRFRGAGFRVVPGAVVRRSAYIAPGAVLMVMWAFSPCPIPVGKPSRTFPRPSLERYEIQGFHTSLYFYQHSS